jgi:hypothetical protein
MALDEAILIATERRLEATLDGEAERDAAFQDPTPPQPPQGEVTTP